MHPIIALVGPSGSGKTTLMDRVISQFPEKFDRIQSFTTRAKRNDADSLYYEFVTRGEVERRKEAGIIVQLIEFNGNYYGTDKPHIEGVLKSKFGMLAVVEYGIPTFTAAGYKVVTIKIEPKGYQQPEERRAADEARAKIEIPIDKHIVNDFAPGGMGRATQELITYLQTLPFSE